MVVLVQVLQQQKINVHMEMYTVVSPLLPMGIHFKISAQWIPETIMVSDLYYVCFLYIHTHD